MGNNQDLKTAYIFRRADNIATETCAAKAMERVLKLIEEGKIPVSEASNCGVDYIPIDYERYYAYYHFVMMALAKSKGVVTPEIKSILEYLQSVTISSFEGFGNPPGINEEQYKVCARLHVDWYLQREEAKANGKTYDRRPIAEIPDDEILY